MALPAGSYLGMPLGATPRQRTVGYALIGAGVAAALLGAWLLYRTRTQS